MKRILSIITVFLLAVTLVACGKSKEIEEVKETLGVLFEDPDNIKSGFVLPTEFNYDVKGTWQSSDVDFLQIGQADDEGMVQVSIIRPAHDKEDKKVKLSVDLKLGKKKDTWSIELTIKKLDKPASVSESFGESVTAKNAGKTIVVNNVALYEKLGTNGYYLSTSDGVLAYVHGQSGMPEKGKLYNITALVDNYYNSLQIKEVNFTPVDGTPDHKVTYLDKTIDNVVALPKPSNDNVYGHDTFKLKNVKVIIDGTGNYNTFMVDKDFNPETDTRTEDNSFMLYYHAQIDAMRALEGLVIEEIDLVLEGYRSDLHVWYFSYLLPIEDIKLAELSDADKVAVAKSTLTLPLEFKTAGTINLPAKGDFDSTITWEYKKADDENNSLINLTNGKVSIPEVGRVNVKLVATITNGEATDTKEFTVAVGEHLLSTVADALALDKGRTIMVKGVVTDKFANNTYGLTDAKGDSIAIYAFDDALTVGREYTLVGEKDVYKGLPQLKNIEIEGSATGVIPEPTAIDAILGDNTELAKHIGGRVSITGAEVTEVSEPDDFGNINVKISKNGVVLTIRYDSRVAGANVEALSLTVGSIVDYVGNLGWNDTPQLGYGPNTILGDDEQPEPSTGEVVTANYNGESTNFEKDIELNQAALINLDETMFTVTGSLAGSYKNAIGLNKAGQIRLYASREDGTGNRLNVSIKEGFKITKIEIDFAAGSNAPFMGLLELDSLIINLAADEVANTVVVKDGLSINGFVIGNNQDSGDKSTQLWINSIVITYSPVE